MRTVDISGVFDRIGVIPIRIPFGFVHHRIHTHRRARIFKQLAEGRRALLVEFLIYIRITGRPLVLA